MIHRTLVLALQRDETKARASQGSAGNLKIRHETQELCLLSLKKLLYFVMICNFPVTLRGGEGGSKS